MEMKTFQKSRERVGGGGGHWMELKGEYCGFTFSYVQCEA
jgi:hypothetical protein